VVVTPFPFWTREVPYQVVLAFVLTALLLRFRRGEHGEFLNTLWIFLLGVGGEALASVVTGMELLTAGDLVHSISRILAAIALIRLSGFAVFRLFLPLLGKRPTRIIEDLAILVAYVVYGFVQLRAAGLDLSSLITTSAILTAVLAFAMQDTLGNVLGGLAIQIDNSVQVGDWVRIDDVVGRVRDVRWRSTIIETRNWETIVIPNSTLMKSRVAILGRRDGSPIQWRRILNFMVDAGVPPARIIAIVDDEMQEIAIPNVARMPAASCVLYGFEQGNLRYQLRYFLTTSLPRCSAQESGSRSRSTPSTPSRATRSMTRRCESASSAAALKCSAGLTCSLRSPIARERRSRSGCSTRRSPAGTS
jgi:small-conductance mechanosensitive channel